MTLYHVASEQVASRILDRGFRGEDELCGVTVGGADDVSGILFTEEEHDYHWSINIYLPAPLMLEVEVEDGDAIDRFIVQGGDNGQRHFMIPAEIANKLPRRVRERV
jgi:hypothetical protein